MGKRAAQYQRKKISSNLAFTVCEESFDLCNIEEKIKWEKKEAKHYHFDWTLISDPGIRFENCVACHLYSWCCNKQDGEGLEYELRYFRNVDKKEVDFVVCLDGKPRHFIECKYGKTQISDGLSYLHNHYPKIPATQIVLDCSEDFISKEGIRVRPAAGFLCDLGSLEAK